MFIEYSDSQFGFMILNGIQSFKQILKYFISCVFVYWNMSFAALVNFLLKIKLMTFLKLLNA